MKEAAGRDLKVLAGTDCPVDCVASCGHPADYRSRDIGAACPCSGSCSFRGRESDAVAPPAAVAARWPVGQSQHRGMVGMVDVVLSRIDQRAVVLAGSRERSGGPHRAYHSAACVACVGLGQPCFLFHYSGACSRDCTCKGLRPSAGAAATTALRWACSLSAGEGRRC